MRKDFKAKREEEALQHYKGNLGRIKKLLAKQAKIEFI